MGNFRLRLRKLVTDAGVVVPTHGHGDRPSIVHVLDGELIEHNAFCDMPIVHKAGDTTPEAGPAHIHGWENKADKAVTVFSTDVMPLKAPDSSEM